MVLGQKSPVLVASVICCQKTYSLHDLNHQTIQYSEREKWWGTDEQTARQTFQSMTQSLLWKGSIKKVTQYNHRCQPCSNRVACAKPVWCFCCLSFFIEDISFRNNNSFYCISTFPKILTEVSSPRSGLTPRDNPPPEKHTEQRY